MLYIIWAVVTQIQVMMERVKGFGPSTSCLGSKHSTAELHPHRRNYIKNLLYVKLPVAYFS